MRLTTSTSTKTLMSEDGFCVVVSHYNARSNYELVRLIRQLNTQIENLKNQLAVKIIVVVNCEKIQELSLPEDLFDIEIQYRENTGFNIGSWDFGWRRNRQYKHYLFLQDECEVVHSGALFEYWQLLESNPNTIIGESLFFYYGWKHFMTQWPLAFKSVVSLAQENNINLGLTPSHLQTLVLAASDNTLSLLDGFILSNNKVDAIATELLLSRKALAYGAFIKQSSWTPFQHFKHDQWVNVRLHAKSLKWSISKCIWYLLYGYRDLLLTKKL